MSCGSESSFAPLAVRQFLHFLPVDIMAFLYDELRDLISFIDREVLVSEVYQDYTDISSISRIYYTGKHIYAVFVRQS